MKVNPLTLVAIGFSAGTGMALLLPRRRRPPERHQDLSLSLLSGGLEDEAAAFRELVRREPPTTHDEFLGLPGNMSGPRFGDPPAGTYCRLTFDVSLRPGALARPQRVLLKQGGTLRGRRHSGGRVVGRFLWDEGIPHGETFFDSDGGRVFYEFQQYRSDVGEWRPFVNTIENVGDQLNRHYIMRSGRASCAIEFGPEVIRPVPPHGFLFLDTKARCVAAGIFSVQTTYAYAWATAVDDRNGPQVAVPELTVSFRYDEFPRGPVSNTARNVSHVEASEQIRQLPANCSGYTVTATGIGLDGRPFEPQSQHFSV